ncbi:dTDP-4-dehydrorhamnose reductase [Thioalkalivibrio sp. XN279]|uniref:dTDP-4-dehydrorhamnose reductase n=1 Tax=Thioalkalivibrio sp. XN279 TaxID=2714953 RepID=UPI00140C3016|nr:dTDP-4-dehydrorhamnose reductase [Thioalkalivibrio sp. XN279]NHA15384.1 dTDP-4-dehydrorhamnose reductase [Thioalkalivibrio sp. XN279]
MSTRPMSIVVLGSSGQLARHLAKSLALTAPAVTFWGRDTADLTEPARVEAALLEAAPQTIINAAAYTAVDKAESEPALAWGVNAEAPAAAARAAAQLGAALVHVSTDYVFDGEAEAPYAEDAPTRPLGVYGATKLAGELAVRTLCPRHWILRTSWVFSEHGHNFVKTMLKLAGERSNLRIVDDQFGRPTYAGHVAELIARLVATSDPAGDSPQLPYGTWHATGGEITTWKRFAVEIFATAVEAGLLDRPPEVDGITTADYPTPARRPTRAVLAPSEELLALDNAPDFDWHAGLARALSVLAEKTKARTP